MPLPFGDLELSQFLALEAAQHIGWIVDAVEVKRRLLTARGWALITQGSQEEVRILVNGIRARTNTWSESPDLEAHFFGILNSPRARFACELAVDDLSRADYLRFELEQAGDAALARRTAWWLRASYGLDDVGDRRRFRVNGTTDRFQFEVGGATLFHRLADYLWGTFGKHYEDLTAILDWGCGAGRLIRHFAYTHGPSICGSDIDADNLTCCEVHYPFARFELFPLRPPSRFASATFDLIIGISVCSHLDERNQQLWLAELRRIAKPGGLVMLSVQGHAQSALYGSAAQDVRKADQHGFIVKGVNPCINDLIGENGYYVDVLQTHEHIRKQWGRHLEVVEIVDGFAANQDLVVMRVP